MTETMPDIDWTPFAKYPVSDTCTCANCCQMFRSHAKFQDGAVWSREPCPTCGFHKLQAVHGDPQSMSISL